MHCSGIVSSGHSLDLNLVLGYLESHNVYGLIAYKNTLKIIRVINRARLDNFSLFLIERLNSLLSGFLDMNLFKKIGKIN